MPPLITLIRHAQALHNPNSEYHLPDPVLTDLGHTQLENYTLPDPKPTLIVTSPFTRTLQTTLLIFPTSTVPIIALPQLQEASDKPCDTGTPLAQLLQKPELVELDAAGRVEWGEVKDGWEVKEGGNAPTEKALRERGRWVREWLDGKVGHIVMVTHGGFLHWLTEEWDGGWGNAEWRRYRLVEGKLVETEESRGRRKKGLGKTERMEVEEVKG